MPIDPVKIPQNVYVEDRIVGPLTLKQTIIMALGGGFSYALYASLSRAAGTLSLFTTVLVWIPCAVTVIFAIVKVNDLSLMRICLLMVERFHKPATRTWAPRRGLGINIRTRSPQLQDHAQVDRIHKEQEKQKKAEEHIRELSTVLDRGMLPNQTEEEVQIEDHLYANDESGEGIDDEIPNFPIDPNRISVDRPNPDDDDGPRLSDLSVFRDIFPKN